MSNGVENVISILLFGLLVAIGIALYFLPTVIGVKRRIRNIRPLIVLNVLGGWCLVGWIAAIVIALRNPPGPMPTRQHTD